jgi:2-polyprenyl-3-methyl-5-hydroxy-6-metoxy-1,4-benzoquinol methylase
VRHAVPLMYRRNLHRNGAHELALALIPQGSAVLDVGCASGYLGEALAERGCRVWGLDRDRSAVEHARAGYEHLQTLDLDAAEELPWPEAQFDVVLAADILEHLRDPGAALRMLHHYLRPGGTLVVSLPNIAHFSIRFPLLLGRFEYRDTGILDRTHLHHFTFDSARELLESCGFAVQRVLAGSDRLGGLVNAHALIGRPLRGLLGHNIVLSGVRKP